MTRLRRAGLVVLATGFTAVVGAAFVIEGLGLAVIAAVGFVVLIGMTIPVLAVFEEERDLPSARAARSSRYPRSR
jgi:hypothetical protein